MGSVDLQAADVAQAGTAATAVRDWRTTSVAGLVLVTRWLFLLAVAVLPLDVYLTVPAAQNGVFLSQVLTAEAAIALVVTVLAGRAFGQVTGLRMAWRDLVPLGMVLAAASFSVIFATSRSVAIKDWLKVLGFLGIYVLARAFRDTKGLRRQALLIMLAGFVVVLISGLLSYTTGLPDISGVLLNIHRSSAAIPFSTVLRAEATFRYPNELAAYLLIMLPFLLACVVTYPDQLERSAGIFIFLLGIYLLVLTYTRGALVAFAVTLPISLYLLAGRRLGVIGAVAVLLGVALVTLKGGVTGTRILSILSLGNSGYSERAAAWQWAWNAFVHHPLFGVGIGNLTLQPNAPYTNHALGLREIDAENLVLNVLAEMGIFGLGAVLYCLGGALRLAWRARELGGTWIDRVWNNGLFVALCALLIFGLGDPVLVSGQVTGLLCVAIGLAGVSPGKEVQPGARRAIGPSERLGKLNDRVAAIEGAQALRSRVVFLINSPRSGIVQLQLVRLAAGLRQRGAGVLVIVPPKSPLLPTLESAGIPSLGVDLGVDLGRGGGIVGLLAWLDPLSRRRTARDVLTLAGAGPSIFVCPFLREQLLVTRWSLHQDTHTVWLLHSTPDFWVRRTLLRRHWTQQARQAGAILAVSPGVAEEARRLGLPAERIELTSGAWPEPPRDTPGVERVPGLIVAMSPLTASEGIQYLIEALPRVLQRYSYVRLAIAGSGSNEPALRRQVQELGLERQVAFLGEVSERWGLLRQASLLVYPAVEPGDVLPSSILNALSVETPVVASAIGSIPDVVVDRRTGLLCWPGDVGSIAGAILTLLDHPDRAQAMGSAGREVARSYVAVRNGGARFLELLAEVEAGQGAQRRIHDSYRGGGDQG
jgi:glycosyltransferase involved in cell wall biosynthesis/O-antigen ligase